MQDTSDNCESSSPPFNDKQYLKAKQGQTIAFEQTGRVKLMPKDHWEGTKIKTNSYVRFIESFEFVWTKDFY